MILDKLLKAMPITVFLMVAGINFLLMLVDNEFLESWQGLINGAFGDTLIFDVCLLMLCVRFNAHYYSYVAVMGLTGTTIINLFFTAIHFEWEYYRFIIGFCSAIYALIVLIMMRYRI